MAARKKSSELDPNTKDRLADFMESEIVAKMRKAHGKNILKLGSEEDDRLRFRIPTGIFPLDFGLSGGIAVGRFSTFYGHKSASKTSTALRAIANAQKMCANCWIPWNWATGEIKCECGDLTQPVVAYVNVEQAYSRKWTEALGVDLSRIVYSAPDYGEQAVDLTEALIESGTVHIVLLDSIAEMVPTAVIEKSAEEGMMADHPRLISRAVHKFLAAMGRCDRVYGFRPTVILINQISFKVGVMFGSPETIKGGQSAGYVASTEVRLQSEKAGDVDELMGPSTVGMKFRVTKQKAGSPYREGDYQLVVRDMEHKKKGQVIDEPQVMKYAERLEMLVHEGNKWTCLDRIFKKKEDVELALMTEPEFSYALRTTLMTKLLAED